MFISSGKRVYNSEFTQWLLLFQIPPKWCLTSAGTGRNFLLRPIVSDDVRPRRPSTLGMNCFGISILPRVFVADEMPVAGCGRDA
jgi:hypothetical protein